MTPHRPPPLRRFGRAEVTRATTVARTVGGRLVWLPTRALREGQVVRPASLALVEAFEQLGPTYVKLGQLIASSPGLFPEPLADACRRTLDEVAPERARTIARVIERDLGASPRTLFRRFDPEPLSSASIAQVHAVTLPDGREAVVKVRRPGLRRRMNSDLRILYQVARRVAGNRYVRMANPVAVIEDLHRVTNEELDLRHEAERQQRFRATLHAFGDNEEVTAPEVIPEFSGRRVICMERLHGTPVDRFTGDPALGERLLRAAVKAWLEAVCVHGPFHGDLHAGNLWILDDGRIAFLDFGITGDLGDEWRAAFRGLLATVMVDGDWGRLVADFARLGVLDVETIDQDAMAGVFGALVAPMLDHTISTVGLGDLLELSLSGMTTLGAVAPRELVLVSKQVLYVERYLRLLAPDWQLARDGSLLRNIHPHSVPCP